VWTTYGPRHQALRPTANAGQARPTGCPHSRASRPQLHRPNNKIFLKLLDEDRRWIAKPSTHSKRNRGSFSSRTQVGSNWRDGEVGYFINYGWGGKTRWISSRQVGANKNVSTVTNVYLVDVSATPLPIAADANEAWCKDWCARAGDNCKMCSSLAGCGPGYESVKSFKSATKNWYACRQRGTDRSQASEANREACEQWCRSRADCVTCSTKKGCGKGYRHLKIWTGYGNNWNACAKRGPSARDQASDANHQACQNWCNSHRPECIKCSTLKGCGAGFKNLKSWTGRGENWHACGHTERRDASDARALIITPSTPLRLPLAAGRASLAESVAVFAVATAAACGRGVARTTAYGNVRRDVLQPWCHPNGGCESCAWR